jgi:hypothetical protein
VETRRARCTPAAPDVGVQELLSAGMWISAGRRCCSCCGVRSRDGTSDRAYCWRRLSLVARARNRARVPGRHGALRRDPARVDAFAQGLLAYFGHKRNARFSLDGGGALSSPDARKDVRGLAECQALYHLWIPWRLLSLALGMMPLVFAVLRPGTSTWA